MQLCGESIYRCFRELFIYFYMQRKRTDVSCIFMMFRGESIEECYSKPYNQWLYGLYVTRRTKHHISIRYEKTPGLDNTKDS